MFHLPRHLPTTLLCGLLWASGQTAQARELRPSEPLRVTLVSLARQATSVEQGLGPKLSVRRAWASGSHAQLCALAMDAQGQPLLDRGRFQMRRIRFEQRQATWRVQRVDTAWLAANESLDAACPRQVPAGDARELDTAPTHLAQRAGGINVAIAEMARHPPTAGLPGGRTTDAAKAGTHCEGNAAADMALVDGATSWPAGQIAPAGRSHLFAAPDGGCPMGKHLVQNDHVRVGATRNGWTQVRYTHPITHVVTVGWLPRHKVVAAQAQVASVAP